MYVRLGLVVVALSIAAPAFAQPSPRQPDTKSDHPGHVNLSPNKREPAPSVVAAREPNLIEAARRQRAYDRPHATDKQESFGVTASFGWSQLHGGVPGWMVRLEHEFFGTFPTGRESGGIAGGMFGYEYWQVNPSPGERDFGFSMPVAFVGGVRLFPLRILLGAGLDALLIDHVKRETGVGIYAPFAMASAAIDLDGWRIGADARAERRWQISADDHTQYQLTFNVGYTGAPDRPSTRRRPVATIAR